MRVSRRWLQQYVDIHLSNDDLAERLTMAGLEVESIDDQAARLAGIVVGEVRSVEKHPNATKLSVCRVFDGKQEVQVVCGAPNVAPKQKVAFAPEGTTVPRNQHDPEGGSLKIGRVSLRGVESAGMICSGYEIGLSDDHEGILVLASQARPGTLVSRHFGLDDTVFEIGVTANRADLLSHIGVAREIGANTGKPLKLPRIPLVEGRKSIHTALQINVEDPVNCPRYSARIVENLRITQSPAWLRDALMSVGIRPINNVVDVTNYVLMESGQPLHAFDYGRISDHTITVRTGENRANFVTLDGKVRETNRDTLLICDGKGPLAIAGVMGGRDSEITEQTQIVVIESAYFNPLSIRRTSKRLGLSTDASQRFERGADPEITTWALDRAAQLINEVAGATVLKGRIDVYPRKIRPLKIAFDVKKSDQLLGVTIKPARVSGLFGKIGIKKIRALKNGSVAYLIPTWRPDITREVDLIEEAARLHGYEKISTVGSIRLTVADKSPLPDIRDTVCEYLSSSGCREIITNSMCDAESAAIFDPSPVLLSNPLSIEMAALRTSLLPGVLTTIKHNVFHGIESSRFYEVGNIFRRKPGSDPDSLNGYVEEEHVCLAIFGLESPIHWDDEPKKSTIFTVKGEAGALLSKISLDNPSYIPYSTPTALSERSIYIEIKGERVGCLGSISKQLRDRYQLETEVIFLDFSLDRLRAVAVAKTGFKPYSRYPLVRRDIAVIVDESIPVGRIEDAIRVVAGPMLRDIVLFDIYRGEQAGAGKKSCALSLEFVPVEGTLEQREILELMGRITEKLKSSLGALLRQ